MSGDSLCQEESAPGVDGQNAVVAFRGGFEDVGSFLGCDAGVVYEDIDLSEFRDGLLEHVFMSAQIGNVSLDWKKSTACFYDPVLDFEQTGFSVFGIVLHVVADDVEPVLGELDSDTAADTAACSCDESDRSVFGFFAFHRVLLM